MGSDRSFDALAATLDPSTGSKTLADAGVERRRGELLKQIVASPGGAARFSERYERSGLLGQGGMGVVHLYADRSIGREVAMKVLHPGEIEGGATWRRFMREARVQGQLEHPAIVPVYEVGLDPEGAPYFTMKRVRGVTLRQVLVGLATKDALVEQDFSRRKLLTALAQVCLAVDFAHSRGVLHRDLKPANVMLGDFGEVYVLDWGLAKVVGFEEDSIDEPVRDYEHSVETSHRSRLGTPGYMAPEHEKGETADTRSDVYALGVMLFEILTRTPFNSVSAPKTDPADVRGRLRGRTADVPPELEEITVRACAMLPQDRYDSAREMHDAIDGYLAGDRDIERRRELAAEHARAATLAADDVLKARLSSSEARRHAMREVSRALAFDPANAEAMRAFVRLVAEPPLTPPPEVTIELEADVQRSRRALARTMAVCAAGLFLFLPLLLAIAPDWRRALLNPSFWGIAILMQLYVARHPKPSPALSVLPVVTWALAIGRFRISNEPFFVGPALAAVVALSFAMNSDARRRLVTTGVCMLSILVPALLEWARIVPPSFVIENGSLLVAPRSMSLPEGPARMMLITGNLLLVGLPAFFVGRFRDTTQEAKKKQFMTAWLMRQLVPNDPHEKTRAVSS